MLSRVMIRFRSIVLLPFLAVLLPAADWHLQWTWQLPPRQPAWEHTQRMDPDWEYVPVRAGDLVLVGCEFNGALLAFDAATGEQRWRFDTEGPIRTAPAVEAGRIALGSQDGHLYLLDFAGKRLASRFLGPYPDQRDRVIGHDRVISAWPLDAPPVFVGDRICVASGVWPLDGVQMWCLDAKTLEPAWFQPNLPVRPFGMFSTGSNIVLRAHGGSRVFDPETGAILPIKAPKPPPRELPEGIPGVEGQAMHRSIQGDLAFVTTKEGKVACFGPTKVEPAHQAWPADDAARKWLPGTDPATPRPPVATTETDQTDDWPQEFHDAANTLASRDKLVRAPLGLLWYGGRAAHGKYYYDGFIDHQSGHGLNPQPVPAQVFQGDLVLQGPGLLAAFDQYTGRLRWECELPSVYTYGGAGGGLGVHSKKHKEPWAVPEAMEFDIKPTQRCRPSGFNIVSHEAGHFLCAGPEIIRVGRDGKRAPYTATPPEPGLCWGGIRQIDDTLVATAFDPRDLVDAQAGHDGNGGDWAGDRMPMRWLVALDLETGAERWRRRAAWGFVNRSGIAAGGGRVFAVDLLTPKVMGKFQEAGRDLPGTPPRLHCLDLASGEEQWRFDLDVYSRNIAYAAQRDLLLLPCRNLMEWEDGAWADKSIDARRGKRNKNAPGRMRALRGADGGVVWDVAEAPYHTPHIVLGDLLIDRYGTPYDLPTGRRNQRVSPLTGEPETWSFRKGGCNHLVACDQLVTWRTACYDLETHRGVIPMPGFDAGCAPTLLPAGGVLNIPNFGTHHKRNRMTAMALVHKPRRATWSIYSSASGKEATAAAVSRAVYDFGAPADRLTDDGLVLGVTPRRRGEIAFTPRSGAEVVVDATAPADALARHRITGLESIRIPLLGEASKDARGVYTVTVHAAPGDTVEVAGRKLTIPDSGLATLTGVAVSPDLELKLVPATRLAAVSVTHEGG